MKTPLLDHWQYRISGTQSQDAVSLGNIWLETGTGLPVTYVKDTDGAPVGVLLGFPIDLAARRLVEGEWQVPAKLDADVDAFVRKGMLALGGRFLWVFHGQGATRIYPDCSAQVPCVFEPQAKVAGSSAHALFDDAEYDARFDTALFNALGVDGEGWFPAGLTAHKGLDRVLPNHYLDLETWTVQRSWFGPEGQTDDPEKLVEEVIQIIQAQMEALIAGPKRVALALTAGRETRMLLACARPFVEQLDLVTIVGGSRTDTEIARRIAGDLGLSHLTPARTDATPEQRALFIRRGGHCNADSNSYFHPSVWPISESHVMISGIGGEVGRAFFWRERDTPQTTLTAPMLTARFGLLEDQKLTDCLDGWLRRLQGINSLYVLDLAYLEHRDGAWYAAQFASDPTLLRQAPLLTTRMVELMLQLPPDWKKTSRLTHEVIARLWPELERYPYNSLGKWQDTLTKLKGAINNPKLIVKKIRKMRG